MPEKLKFPSHADRTKLFARDFDLKRSHSIIWPINAQIGDHIIDFELLLSLKKLLLKNSNPSEIILCLQDNHFRFFERFLRICKIADKITTPDKLSEINLKFSPTIVEAQKNFRLFFLYPFASQWDMRWAMAGFPGPFVANEAILKGNRFKAALKNETRELRKVCKLPRKYLLFSPDASWNRNKEWPRSHWVKLAHGVTKKLGVEVVVLTNQTIKWKDRPKNIHLYDYTSVPGSDFLRLLSLIDGAEKMISVDAAPAHGAGLLSKKCLVLWGETSPLAWGHRNNIHVRIGEDTRNIKVGDILRLV